MAYEGMLILNILNICISFHKELNNIAALFYCISYENHMHRNIGLTWKFLQWNNLKPTIFPNSAKYLPNTYFYAVGKLLMLCGKTPQVFKQSWSVKTWNVHLINRHNVWCLLRSCISLLLLRTICFLSQVNNGCINHLNLYICIFLLWRFTFSTNLAEKMYRR